MEDQSEGLLRTRLLYLCGHGPECVHFDRIPMFPCRTWTTWWNWIIMQWSDLDQRMSKKEESLFKPAVLLCLRCSRNRCPNLDLNAASFSSHWATFVCWTKISTEYAALLIIRFFIVRLGVVPGHPLPNQHQVTVS